MKQIHPHYEDVTIRDDKLCDPILTEEEDNDDDDLDENMDNADYDKDLMETDMYKESALCEAEDDPENDQDIVMQPCYNQQPEEPWDATEQEDDMPNGGFTPESWKLWDVVNLDSLL